MNLPVPGPTTAELVCLFEAVHQGLTERDQARAELEEERKLAANLGLDNRALKDRLRERDETIAQQGRTQADSDTLVRRLRDTDATPLRQGPRPHLGPPVRCWCGMTHSHEQATALNAGRDRIEANK